MSSQKCSFFGGRDATSMERQKAGEFYEGMMQINDECTSGRHRMYETCGPPVLGYFGIGRGSCVTKRQAVTSMRDAPEPDPTPTYKGEPVASYSYEEQTSGKPSSSGEIPNGAECDRALTTLLGSPGGIRTYDSASQARHPSGCFVRRVGSLESRVFNPTSTDVECSDTNACIVRTTTS